MTHTIKRIKRPNKEKKRCADRCCYSIDTFSGLTQIPNEMNKGENEALVLFRASGVEWKTFLWLWLHHTYKTSSAQTFTHTITKSIARWSTFLISQKKKTQQNMALVELRSFRLVHILYSKILWHRPGGGSDECFAFFILITLSLWMHLVYCSICVGILITITGFKCDFCV